MNCPNCGNLIRNPLNFCPYCREPLNPYAPVININKGKSTKQRKGYRTILLILIAALALFGLYKYKGQESLISVASKIPFLNKQEAVPDKAQRASAGQSSPTSPLIYVEPATGIEFVFVKGGCFQQGDVFNEGDNDERPVHEVCIKDFYISKFEVTQAQWLSLMKKSASAQSKGKDIPMSNVSWKDVHDFFEELKKAAPNHKFRLPTESEWEYVCRDGGKKQRYSGTSNEAELPKYAWVGTNSEGLLHSAGALKPNALGIHDMSGNLWEWVEDDYKPDCYQGADKENPICIGGTNRVIRGGSYQLSAHFARCAARGNASPLSKSPSTGFRAARDI